MAMISNYASALSIFNYSVEYLSLIHSSLPTTDLDSHHTNGKHTKGSRTSEYDGKRSGPWLISQNEGRKELSVGRLLRPLLASSEL